MIYKDFKSAIVNRSDQKQDNLASINQLLNIAGQAQVTIIYQLITTAQVSATDIIEFSKYYNRLPKTNFNDMRSRTYFALLFK